ncbi:helix-turn-helix domain-containing protein [Roseateles sp.]|uniref:winged helix-turn-helix transcriptional regulator n=1 Tax=Roseateles sp. TaxID=1971397 RepID=UPI002F3FA3FC
MKSKGFEGMICSMASVMGALGDRWGALIVRDLYLGLRRYDDLRESTGASNATLSDRLKSLQQSGLVERRLYQTRPDRYEYVLTPEGQEVGLVLLAMVQVGDKWNVDGLPGPPLRFVDASTGRAVLLNLVDAQTGQPVDPSHLSIEAGPGADDLTRWRLERARAMR